MTVKQILIPIDFSTTSINALKYGAVMAQKFGAKLQIMHAYHVTASGDTALFVNEAMIENHQLLAEGKLKELAADIPELKTVSYTLSVKFGLTSSCILERLNIKDIDLVIMGSKGETDLVSKLFGSTTNDIINNANCPVIAIPKEVKAVNWDNVVMAIDNTDMAIEGPKSWVSYLHEIFGSKFHVVHVNDQPDQKNYEELFKPSLQQIFGNIAYRFHTITSNSVERGLIDYMKGLDANVLMIYPRKRHILIDLFTHKVTKHLCEQMHQPVFAYREG
ncbi:universal stress protein [Fulvivirgaceae bacterium BMA12]|uniref:Universal stress protein n=1 Tax=Agaribacillus aureus TaxID=3051825 RepID=A0ABT8KZQ6_9BACT|nr:universal stress protein [Fulvivirgaceae bacterium BMA12]